MGGSGEARARKERFVALIEDGPRCGYRTRCTTCEDGHFVAMQEPVKRRRRTVVTLCLNRTVGFAVWQKRYRVEFHPITPKSRLFVYHTNFHHLTFHALPFMLLFSVNMRPRSSILRLPFRIRGSRLLILVNPLLEQQISASSQTPTDRNIPSSLHHSSLPTSLPPSWPHKSTAVPSQAHPSPSSPSIHRSFGNHA